MQEKIQAETISSFRKDKVARASFDIVYQKVLAEYTIACGEVAALGADMHRDTTNAAQKGAIERLSDTYLAVKVFNRVNKTLAHQNTKPISAKAVGWVIQKYAPQTALEPSEINQLMTALNLDNRVNYEIPPQVRSRMIEEFQTDAIAQQNTRQGLAVS
jgi:hypothetical protein